MSDLQQQVNDLTAKNQNLDNQVKGLTAQLEIASAEKQALDASYGEFIRSNHQLRTQVNLKNNALTKVTKENQDLQKSLNDVQTQLQQSLEKEKASLEAGSHLDKPLSAVPTPAKQAAKA